MSTADEIKPAMMRRSNEDRLKLADNRLGSRPPPPTAGTADDILNEALRRDAELETGSVRALSETEFWNGIRRAQG